MISWTVRVPATSANLGPGFDTLGLALAHYDEYRVEVAGKKTEVTVRGEGADQVPTDSDNLVLRALHSVFESVGEEPPVVRLTCENSIPHGRGMGSSGAAVAGGVMLASALLEGKRTFSDRELLDFATALEGHPDNVAPALFGGLTIAWKDAGGAHYKKLTAHRGVSPLLLVAPNQMSTKLARSLQPESVPHADAVFNLSRSALLVAALIQSPELLLVATEDKLHQIYRSTAMPNSADLVTLLRENGHPAVISGAGPSVLVLEAEPSRRLAARDLALESFRDWIPLLLAVDYKGASLSSAA